MLLQLKYIKPYSKIYDVFYNGERIRKGKEYSIENDSNIQLIEKNIFSSKWWWLLVLFNMIISLTGSFDDWKNESGKQKVINIKLGKIVDKILLIKIPKDSSKIMVDGVENFEIISILEKDIPDWNRRFKIAKLSIPVFAISIIVIIALILLFTLI